MSRSTRLPVRRAYATLAAVSALVLTAGCSSNAPAAGESEASAESATSDVEEAAEDTAAESCTYPVTVTDMAGNEVTVESVDSVVVTDNRMFATIADWGIQPTAAPRTLMSPNNPMKDDDSILDTGSHGEPDFTKVIEADPTVIISGYRYGDHADALKDAAPGAAFIDTTNNEMTADEYAVASTQMLGEIFCMQDKATELVDQFHTSLEETKAAYDPAMTVMGLVTSGNEIRYSNPTDGRGASIYFSLLGLTPALDQDGSTNHQGDDISLEAIAESNPDFYLVLDRDAAFAGSDGEETTPALELINGSASLAATPAVVNQAIYIMPADYYLTEDIYAYMDVLSGLKQAFEAQR